MSPWASPGESECNWRSIKRSVSSSLMGEGRLYTQADRSPPPLPHFRPRLADGMRARQHARMSLRLVMVSLCVAFVAGCGPGRAPAPLDATARQFTFAWPFREGASVAPRGGTTQGTAVELKTEPGPEWKALQAPGLSPRERDRRAILAMAGTFRTTFDFLEVAGFRAGFTPDRPYQSWATEWVSVVRDEPRLVSLQHLLVMFMRG